MKRTGNLLTSGFTLGLVVALLSGCAGTAKVSQPAVQTAPLMTGESAPHLQMPLTSGFARTAFEQEEAQAQAIEARQREESK